METLLNADEGHSELQWDSCLPCQKTTYINFNSTRSGPKDWILQPAITSPHLTLLHWWTPLVLTQQDYYSSLQIANKALCHRFPVHRLCACQSLTASWGAIHGWVSCLLPHPLLFLAAVQSALTAPGQVAGLRYSMHSAQPTTQKSAHSEDKYFTKKHTGEWADGWTVSPSQWSSWKIT